MSDEITGHIVVPLTSRECDVLARLSEKLELPQDRVMVLALRQYQLIHEPVRALPMIAECDVCGCGCYLPSGVCDHCNTRRPYSERR